MTRIISTETGASLPIPSACCRQAISPQVADAVNDVLQGVLNFPGATGAWGSGSTGWQPGRPAPRTTPSTPRSAATRPIWPPTCPFFHPTDPANNLMLAPVNSCYEQQGGSLACNGEMFGADGARPLERVQHANLGVGRGSFPSPATAR